MRPPARLSSLLVALLVALLAALCLPAVRVHAQLFPVIEPFPLLRAYVSGPRPRLSLFHALTHPLARSLTHSLTHALNDFHTKGIRNKRPFGSTMPSPRKTLARP